jgi:hypothetical protein
MPEPHPFEREQAPSCVPPERRAWVRFGTDLQATCRGPGGRKEVGWPARVRDVSAGGLGLVLRHRFRPGTPLLVEIHGPAGGPGRVLAARVVHARPVQPGTATCWLVGCAFLTPLGDDELRALLETSDKSAGE